MKPLKIAVIIAALHVAACGAVLAPPAAPPASTPPPASPPVSPTAQVRTVAVVVRTPGGDPIADTSCQLEDAPEYLPHDKATNGDGYVAWHDVSAGLRNTAIHCERGGFVALHVSAILKTSGNEDLPGVVMQPLAPSAGEHGFVHVDGLVFRREDSSIFPWRGSTDFLLFKRFLDGEDLNPVLTQRIAAGVNVVRVLGMVDTFAHLRPQERADYYEQLGAFADLLAARGLRLEFVVFADAQIIMADADAELAHLARVADVLASRWNVFLEISNEPFKNIPGNGAAACALARRVTSRGPPVASGHYDFDGDIGGDTAGRCAAQYITYHGPRKPEWPRTAKDSLDIRDWAHVPVVQDEPTGFAEQPDGDRRSTSADDAAYFAAAAQLEGAGSTFHSDAGILSQSWGPVQLAAARAWFGAGRWVPAEAQLWPYQRGGDAGTAGVGNMPLEHDDQLALRTFCKGNGSDEWCVAIRPAAAWRAVARDGWRIVDEPRRGFVRLTR